MGRPQGWVPILTQPESGVWKPLNDIGHEFHMKTELLVYHDALKDTFWDFTQGDVAASIIPDVEAGTSPASFGVRGMLWTAVRLYAGNDTTGHAQKYGNFYGPGNPVARFTRPPLPGSGALEGNGPFQTGCPACSQYVSRLFTKVGDPGVYRATGNGLVRVADVSPIQSQLYHQVATGAVRMVAAAEPLHRQAQVVLPYLPKLRGVTLDGSTVGSRIVTTYLDAAPAPAFSYIDGYIPDSGNLPSPSAPAAPSLQAAVAQPTAPVLHGNEAIVLSGVLHQLYVIGGTDDGTPDGSPNPSAWVLDVDSNAWTEIPLPAGQRPGAVVGATFRLDDLAVYVADRINGTTRIRRWAAPQAVVTELAKLPDSWNVFDRRWLVAGAEGDLLFAAARNQGGGPHQSLYARFTVGSNDKLSFAGMKLSPTKILSEPILGQTGIAIVVSHPTGAALSTVALTELGMAPPGFLPTIE